MCSSDLDALVASTAGKVEIETLDDGREDLVLDRIIKAATLEVFRARVRPELLGDLLKAFEGDFVVHTGDDLAASDYAALFPNLPNMSTIAAELGVGDTPAGHAAAIELVLEGMHLTKRLNKDAVGGRATYRARG